jgi:nucleotide-binding universal stress UspA family protein
MPRLFRTVLVPHDFSAHATLALRVAADLAAADKGRLVVLHAMPPAYPVPALAPAAPAAWVPSAIPSPEFVAHERDRLRALVAGAVGGRRKVRAECRVVVADPFQAILEAARGATSIVMSTLGRTGLAHLLMGSVAEKVVRHAPVPVLTIRPRATRGRRPRRSRRR